MEVFETYYDAVNGQPNSRGEHLPHQPAAHHLSCLFRQRDRGHCPMAGKPAVPFGRHFTRAGNGPQGPTAVLKSALRIDHLKTGGTLLNQKFTPEFFGDESSITKITKLIRSYFRMDGHHIQFNVVSADTLRDAQKHPEKYRDLIVRVAGYSDYFNDLGTDLQDEIIRRTEHESA